ncbi:MAG: thiosulfate oxidation carrier complex protein SoxZ [Alphaproteobacteria bacterium]|jgi:sulfur-oxidizing protein SoxZ|nr:thiosulfate oxidation carrier complex protein SoxZ [Alphaproteobacteria bacterium]MBT4711062.1 thiosulfate oxidation carrier complex protein SoxZ [Alphaproteobacteria bacterium]MBT5859588.1 thiosulfate oxidation carrier complex protein SoxZ [Alphaproteobacteria bacterium]
MATIRISIPETAAKDEIVEIRTLISHPMDNGYNVDARGQRIPRHILHTFIVTYNGVEVFHANLHPAQSTNPYMVFHTVAVETGTLEFTWLDDDGSVFSDTRTITVQ